MKILVFYEESVCVCVWICGVKIINDLKKLTQKRISKWETRNYGAAAKNNIQKNNWNILRKNLSTNWKIKNINFIEKNYV